MSFLKKIKRILWEYTLIIPIKVILIIGFFLVSGYTINGIVSIEYPFDNRVIGNYDDWISFYGNILGGFIGVIIALYIFSQKDRKDKHNREIKLNVQLNQYKHYLEKTFKRIKIIEENINSIKEHKRFQPGRMHFYEISFKDFSEVLISLNLNQDLSSEVLNKNMNLEIEIEFFNNIMLQLQEDLILEESVLKRKYGFTDHSKIRDYYIAKDAIIDAKYFQLLMILDTIKNIINEIKSMF